MGINQPAFQQISTQLAEAAAQLVAVSKTKPVADVQAMYTLGQRHFGENYVQELVEKHEQLPADIHWHFIGHLQTNKVKYIAPFVTLIHGIDSEKLLVEVQKQAHKYERTIGVLLQIHIAAEETKFGLDAAELAALLATDTAVKFPNVRIVGLMGMASFTADAEQIHQEFSSLQQLFLKYQSHFSVENTMFTTPQLSMGMSGDYTIALQYGATLVRIGSLLFGERNKK
jgi:PLP dependent protein